ncbi:MAG: DNA primase [Frankiaceae bacterium]
MPPSLPAQSPATGSSGRGGRLRDDDIALVRERAAIAEVVGDHLQLRAAGSGRLKGLCPFHDEKTPSFHVNPDQGFYHCFGCGAGGDVIRFVQEIEHLTFRESVEQLAARFGVELRYEQGGASPRGERSQRQRLLQANAAAAAFYAERLATDPEGRPAREELAKRGFDQAAAETFGCGYAPRGWDVALRHLLGRGFTIDELRAAGLVAEGRRGPVDRFRGRLLWPIADIAGDVIAFGARKLYDDDPQSKYVNTPETVLYKKSHVLYGLHLAKREIARRMQAVVVEGYTDVMACHLAGVPTAVATCGTAFGDDHIRLLRRLLMDQDEFRGEVIFTFDGDAAGRNAALKAFADEQKFITQTFVSVEQGGLDPCDLRMARGDAAVRDLVAARIPLSAFAIRNAIDGYDLETAEGRTSATRAGMAIVQQLKDVSLRIDYARRLAGWLGLPDPDELVVEARGGVADVRRRGAQLKQSGRAEPTRPDPHDPHLLVEREVLKVALQRPALAGPVFDVLGADSFTAPGYRAVREAIAAAGGCALADGTPAWANRVAELAAGPVVHGLVTELAVEPPLSDRELDERYVAAQLARLQEIGVTRRTVEVKSRLQRLNPLEAPDDYNRLAGELFALEQYRRALREQAIGAL